MRRGGAGYALGKGGSQLDMLALQGQVLQHILPQILRGSEKIGDGKRGYRVITSTQTPGRERGATSVGTLIVAREI